MNKILGYILTALGVIGIAAYSVPQVKQSIPGLSEVTDTILITISIILFLIGIFFIVKGGGGGRQAREVPIYHGKNVVGYRRHKK